MAFRSESERFLSTAILLLLSAVAARGQFLRLDPVPVGSRPAGVEITFVGDPNRTGFRLYAGVANSGDNSVTIFDFTAIGSSLPDSPAAVPRVNIPGIPEPYAVRACFGYFLVTSPSDNSVTVVKLPEASVVARLSVGREPRSAACYSDGGPKAVVSNLGDNTLALVDLTSLAITAVIPDVPGSRGLRGVGGSARGTDPIAWVAGTEADVVTLVDLKSRRILTRIPLRRPTLIGGFNPVFVASSVENSITFFNADTLQVTRTLAGIADLQDLVVSPLDNLGTAYFITTFGGDLARLAYQNNNLVERNLIGEVPRATGLAAWSGTFGFFVAFVLVTSPETNQVFFVRPAAGPPSEFATANGATFGARIAPGSLATVFATTGVSQNFVADSLPLRTSLGGVTLRVGGTLTFDNSRWVYSGTGAVAAPLLFAGPTQINFQVPPALSPGDMVPIQLTRLDGSTLLSNFRLTATSPGIFTVLATGQGQAAVLNQDNSLNFGTRPAAGGSVIQIFATGAGATNPPLLSGEPAPISGNPLVFTQVQPTVTIGGQPARVLFSGMAPGFVGVWQINAEIPMDVTPGPAVPLQVTAGGVASNTVTIAVR